MQAKEVAVDWQVWQHVPAARLWEAVALSLNRDPRSINVHPQSWMADRFIFEESKPFTDRLMIAERNLTASGAGLRARSLVIGAPSQCSVSLAEFAAWALSLPWDIPPELERIAASHSMSVSDDVAVTESPITTRERNTLLTIIAALCDYSGIDPAGKGTANQIAKMTETLGATVTDDTIRKALAKIPDALETRMK